jgi:hypothetical protein
MNYLHKFTIRAVISTALMSNDHALSLPGELQHYTYTVIIETAAQSSVPNAILGRVLLSTSTPRASSTHG